MDVEMHFSSRRRARRRSSSLPATALVFFLLATAALAQSLTFTPQKKSGVYEVGEKIGWSVEVGGW